MPFSIENDGVMCVCMKSDKGNDQMYLGVEVRGGTKSSRYEVVFRLASSSSPYRYSLSQMPFFLLLFSSCRHICCIKILVISH